MNSETRLLIERQAEHIETRIKSSKRDIEGLETALIDARQGLAAQEARLAALKEDLTRYELVSA